MFIHLVIKIKKNERSYASQKKYKSNKKVKKEKKRLTCNVKVDYIVMIKKIVKINCINALLISVFENVRIR